MTQLPSDLRYSNEHEWVRNDADTKVRIGVTAFAADAMGDVVYISLPTVGSSVVAGDACGELESTKSVSDLYSPVTGVITGVNEQAIETPELINSSPFEDGWLFEVELSNTEELDDLLDAEAYEKLTAEAE